MRDLGPLAPLVDAIAAAVASRLQPDELVPLDACGLERAAALRLVASGELPVRKIGRKRYTLRSALVRLVAAPGTGPEPDDGPEAMLEAWVACDRRRKAVRP